MEMQVLKETAGKILKISRKKILIKNKISCMKKTN